MRPTSQQGMMQRMMMENMNQAFTTPQQMIDRSDFTNRGEVMHNNLGEKLLSEHVVDYKVHINSQDRNTTKYASPFRFLVPFGGISNPANTQEAVIERKFKNVKYITLDSIILPTALTIDTSQIDIGATDYNIYPINSSLNPTPEAAPTLKILGNHRYLLVTITNDMQGNQKFPNDRTLGTSHLYDRESFIIVPDYQTGLDSFVWRPLHNSRIIFQNSQLANINNLCFRITDESGNDLTLYNEENVNIITGNIAVGITMNFNTYVKTYASNTNVSYTNLVMQSFFNLTLGVIENELNTRTNY